MTISVETETRHYTIIQSKAVPLTLRTADNGMTIFCNRIRVLHMIKQKRKK